jgi:hypothetical protein
VHVCGSDDRFFLSLVRGYYRRDWSYSRVDDREFCSGICHPHFRRRREYSIKSKTRFKLDTQEIFGQSNSSKRDNQDDHGKNPWFLESLRTLVRGAEQDCHEGLDSQGRSGPSFLPDREKIGLASRVIMRYGVWVRGKSARGIDIRDFVDLGHACG